MTVKVCLRHSIYKMLSRVSTVLRQCHWMCWRKDQQNGLPCSRIALLSVAMSNTVPNITGSPSVRMPAQKHPLDLAGQGPTVSVAQYLRYDSRDTISTAQRPHVPIEQQLGVLGGALGHLLRLVCNYHTCNLRLLLLLTKTSCIHNLTMLCYWAAAVMYAVFTTASTLFKL
jgi:hypothetical protein